MSPQVVEVIPVALGARAFGLAQASNGIGKTLGPVCLAGCELAALIAIIAYR
jgi:putative MFS transporter